MKKKLLCILGHVDREMSHIQDILRESGIPFFHLLGEDGAPIDAQSAYDSRNRLPSVEAEEIVLVECFAQTPPGTKVTRIDHHRPGDPGYSATPREFLQGSSIGQLLLILVARGGVELPWTPHCIIPGPHTIPSYLFDSDYNTWILLDPLRNRSLIVPDEILVTAAGDHCLEAAYRGRCPGVRPEAIRDSRIRQMASWSGLTPEAIQDRFEEACRQITRAPRLRHGPFSVADLRETSTHPIIVDAACYLRIPSLCSPPTPPAQAQQGRKITLSAASPELVTEFLEGRLIPGICRTYGVPNRGFAGGFLPSTQS